MESRPDHKLQAIIEEVCCKQCDVNVDTLESVIMLAVEIAREGREGRKIGTIFVIGDVEAVLKQSRPLVLDPLKGHPRSELHVSIPSVRESVKEFAQLDGGFVVAEDGAVLSAARYFNSTSDGVDLPLGLGSRHMAGASISRATEAVAVVVSESSIVRLFNNGRLISEIIPEVWMLRRQGVLFADGAADMQSADGVTVLSASG